MAYCTSSDVKEFNGDPDMNDFVLNIVIGAVDQGIDQWCRRTFVVSPADSRLYDAVDTEEIVLIHDMVSVDSVVTNGGDTYLTADLVLLPASGPPYRRIRLADRTNRFTWTGTETNAYTVTGTWGYKATTPTQVKLASIMWVSDIMATSDSRGVSSISAGGIKTTSKFLGDKPPDDVISLLPAPRVRIEALA